MSAMMPQQRDLIPQEPETATILSIVARAAADPTVDIDKMERLMQMRERELERVGQQEFNQALNAAQADMGRVAANRTNSQTGSKYADYAALDRVLRPIYIQHGFALSFSSEPAGESVLRVVASLSHRGGHSARYQIDMPADGKGAKGNDVMTKTHATGSAMSYGQRYLLKSIFNVAVGETDDDGNAASAYVAPEHEAKADEFYQAIAEAETVDTLKKNVGAAIAASGLPPLLLKRVRSTYTSRLNRLREAEGRK
jgi:hypothetical protein